MPEPSLQLSFTVIVFLMSGDIAGLRRTLSSIEAQKRQPDRVLLVCPPGEDHEPLRRHFTEPQQLGAAISQLAYAELAAALLEDCSDAFAFLHSGSMALPHRLEHDERLLRLHPVGAILTLPLLLSAHGTYQQSPWKLLPEEVFQNDLPRLPGRQLLKLSGDLATNTWFLDCLTLRAAGLRARIQSVDLSIIPGIERWLRDCGEVQLADRCLTSCRPAPSASQRQSAVLLNRFVSEKTSPIISVIVPCWNVESYLEDCLESIRTQSFERYELICVDDGSSDATPEILRSYEPVFSGRMRIITHHSNLGLGEARNAAIVHARGDYLASVDSDDWIDPGMLDTLYSCAVECRADVVSIGYKAVSTNGMVIRRHQYPRSHRIMTEYDDVFSLCIPSFCNKLWRRELFSDSGIAFPSGVFFEDLATTPRVLALASTIAFADGCPYNYRQRPSSIMRSISLGHIVSYSTVFDMLSESFSTRLASSHLFRTQFCNMIESNIVYFLSCDGGVELNSTHAAALSALGIGYIEHVQRTYGRLDEDLLPRLSSFLPQDSH